MINFYVIEVFIKDRWSPIIRCDKYENILLQYNKLKKDFSNENFRLIKILKIN